MQPTVGATCTTCGRLVQGSFCGGCGMPVHAPPVSRRPDKDTGGQISRPLLLLGAGVVVALVLGGVALFSGGDDPAATTSPSGPTATTAPQPVPAGAAARVVASCQRAGSVDGANRATSYEPERAVDGDPTTAWRCDGDGRGQSLVLTFSAPVQVDRIGLIPGLAKTDPGDGTDRYAQNRRISAVRIATETGRTVDAQLDTSAGNRVVQTIDLGAPVVTRTLTVSITGSVPGTEQNGQAAVDSVAIAEIICY